MLQTGFKSWVLAGLLLASLIAAPLPAPPLDPPSKILQSARTQVVVGAFAGRLPDGRYRFIEVSGIRGPDEAPAEVLVRGPDWLSAWLSPQRRYLFAYTAYLRNPRFRKEVLVDTDGPRLVDGPGLEPALFLDSEGLRAALLHPLDHDTLKTRAFLDGVVAGLASRDTQIHNFHAAELALIGDLGRSGDAALVRAVKSLIDQRDAHPAARATLLRVAAANDAIYSREYLAGAVQRILDHAPLSGYQQAQPGPGELVALALQLAREHALKVDLGALQRLIPCDSAAIAEAALLAIRSIDPERERAAAREALELTQLPATTRDFLLDHLRRLDLAAGRSAPNKATSRRGDGE